jgi:Zn ribbon nucleic-acid-binding protein
MLAAVDCQCGAPKEDVKLLYYTSWVSARKCSKCGHAMVAQVVIDEALAKFVAKTR